METANGDGVADGRAGGRAGGGGGVVVSVAALGPCHSREPLVRSFGWHALALVVYRVLCVPAAN